MSALYQVEIGDVADVPSDLLFLKHAGTFYGADRHVAGKLIAGVFALARNSICDLANTR